MTIITPSFNQGQYIEQTIQSVLSQNYPNLEYMIIDGGSTDNTIEVIKKYEKHLAYWVSETDHGQAHAISKGLEKATGTVFNWLNSDDYLEPGSLLAIGEHFLKHPNTDVLCGFTHCFFDETGETSHTYQMGIKKTVADTILQVEMNQPGTYYKMDIIKSLGGVNESLRYVFDDELWFRYLCRHGMQNIAFTDKLIAHFRLHGNSKSVGEGYLEFWKEIMEIYLAMAKQIPLPAFIIDYMEKDTLSISYSTKTWDFTLLEKGRFEAWFCNKYQYSFYKDFKYNEAVYCFKKARKHQFIRPEKKAFILCLKIFVVPRFLMDGYRNSNKLFRITILLSLIMNLFFVVYGFKNKIYWLYKKEKYEYVKNVKPCAEIQYYLGRNKLFELLPEIDSTDIVFIGDSHIREFPTDELFSNFSTKNRGINGDNTNGVLCRLETILKGKPKSIVIQIGINDLASKMKTDYIIANYSKIISEIKSKSPLTKIYVNSIPPVVDSLHHLNEKIIRTNLEIGKIAKSQSCIFIDIYSLLQENNELKIEYANYDGYHLSALAYKAWHQILINNLNK